MVLRSFCALLAVALAIVTGWICWRRRFTPGARALLVFAITLAVWGAIYALWWGTGRVPDSVVLAISALADSLAPIAFFLFALQYTQRGYVLHWSHLLLLGLIPLTVQGLLWSHVTLRGEEVWRWLTTLSMDTFLLLAVFILIRAGVYGPRPYRRQFSLMLFGALVPFFLGIVPLANIRLSDLNLTPLPFTLTDLALLSSLLLYRLLVTTPLPRELVIEKMGDGWMVLDAHDRVVDLNPAAEQLLDTRRDRIFGKEGEKVLARWQSLRASFDKEVNINGSVQVGTEWRYLQMRVSPLLDGKRPLGRVILWKDITDWQKAEEARRQARDEMFILLHAVSGAATRAVSLEDFLTEALLQIAYAFHSQMGVLFLFEGGEAGQGRLVLKAYHGLSADLVQRFSVLGEVPPFMREIIASGEARQITDIRQEAAFSEATRQLGAYSLLVLPLRMDNATVGIICLARPAGQWYRQDEITRLMVIADEIATFIYSERQRQLNIALAERERLVRDLHDSLSAKLYGVLTLTEAAQAGLEAGHADMPARVLARIGEQARQALKEMRLFLHELEPLNLEREELASALAQRLAAVEGRADIRTRLLMDETIALPLQTKVALYFIAQEALNNALRHADARSVTVRLQRKHAHLLFEIRDDGRGFDVKRVGSGGRGLRNMRERAEKIGAKLTILSRNGEGTTVRVTLPWGETEPALTEEVAS